MTKWDERFMELAHTVASWSKDPERKVGCVLVYEGMHQFSLGYNGLPRLVKDTAERINDAMVKNSMTVHAELNAILNARADVTGCEAYITAAPCLECCKAMIQAGISSVVCPAPVKSSTWYESQQFGLNLLHESDIIIAHYGDIIDSECDKQGLNNNSIQDKSDDN